MVSVRCVVLIGLFVLMLGGCPVAGYVSAEEDEVGGGGPPPSQFDPNFPFGRIVNAPGHNPAMSWKPNTSSSTVDFMLCELNLTADRKNAYCAPNPWCFDDDVIYKNRSIKSYTTVKQNLIGHCEEPSPKVPVTCTTRGDIVCAEVDFFLAPVCDWRYPAEKNIPLYVTGCNPSNPTRPRRH
jgi:hypothetical protein